MNSIKLIATHDGSFHADDVFAIAILLKLFPSAKIIRTREPEELKKADLRVDVGFKYNFETGDYDHHQAGGAGKRQNGIEYAACGLIWKHFGQELCTIEVFKTMDGRIMQFIDAEDLGAVSYDDKLPPVTISDIIRMFNPVWNKTPNYDAQFFEAVKFAQNLLERALAHAESEEAGKVAVRNALKKSTNSNYVVLESYAPWKEVLINESKVAYVIFPSAENKDWSVYCVPEKKHSFTSRKPLPTEWGGKADEDLAKITGVKDSIFCHTNLFIAKAKTKEGAIKLAKLAIEYKL